MHRIAFLIMYISISSSVVSCKNHRIVSFEIYYNTPLFFPLFHFLFPKQTYNQKNNDARWQTRRISGKSEGQSTSVLTTIVSRAAKIVSLNDSKRKKLNSPLPSLIERPTGRSSETTEDQIRSEASKSYKILFYSSVGNSLWICRCQLRALPFTCIVDRSSKGTPSRIVQFSYLPLISNISPSENL